MAYSYFTDPDKLQEKRFSYGLSTPSFNADSEFSESVSLSLYVDEHGDVNMAERLFLHRALDPIDSNSVPSFSPENKFIEGLSLAIGALPEGSIILFPTYRFDREGRRDLMYPKHTPKGFVPCVGQSLSYPGGKTIYVPYLPVTPGYPAAYMMRVEPGWKTPDPALPPGATSQPLAEVRPTIFTLT